MEIENKKIYAPSVITLGASATSIFMSHYINVKKIASVTAACSTLDEIISINERLKNLLLKKEY